MKIKNYYIPKDKLFKILNTVMFIVFAVIFVYMELKRERGEFHPISSKDFTDEVKTRIANYSYLFELLIAYLIYLTGRAFISIFKLVISPKVGGKIYKVVLGAIVYISCIIVAISGYSKIIVAEHFMGLTSVLTYPAIFSTYSHIYTLIMLQVGKLIERSIVKDNRLVYEKLIVNSKKQYDDFNVLRGIIENESNKK